MRTLRNLHHLLLAVVIGVTSLSAATAHGRTTAGQEVVICSGGALVSVVLDKDGNPVERVQICPDYALSLFAAALPGLAEPVRPAGFVVALSPNPILPGASLYLPEATARGPPPVV